MLVLQKAIKAEEDLTLAAYLARAIPHLFTLSEEGELIHECSYVRVVVNGIDAGLDTSLYWLVLNMAGADNFLYLSVLYN